ncbi:MAG: response regulator transcription factor [Terriglobia bacterium]
MSQQTELQSLGGLVGGVGATAWRARILLVEDDPAVSKLLQERMEKDLFAIDISYDGAAAEGLAGAPEYDLVILDLNLPQVDGLDLLQRMRTRNNLVPILVLTGRCGLEDRVNALELGADDYLTKPFEYPELVARVRALLRRLRPSGDAISRLEDLELNRISRTVTRGGRVVELTPKEFALLEYLMANLGRCLTRDMIMQHVWKLSAGSVTNVVDVYINYLRNKLDRDFERKLIRTVRGAGYQMGEVSRLLQA